MKDESERDRLTIDASNLIKGGGVTHLIELLAAAEPQQHGFERVTVWATKRITDQLPDRSWLRPATHPLLEGSIVQRIRWQELVLGRALAAEPNQVLWVPGGSYGGRHTPFVTMMRNLLPFDPPERRRTGLSKNRLRLKVLQWVQTRTFRQAAGVIFLSEHSRRKAAAVTGPLKGASVVIPHGIGNQFFQKPRPQRDHANVSPAEPFRLLYVSVIDLYKHQWHVAEAVARVRQAGIPVRVDFVGPVQRLARERWAATLRRLDPDGEYLIARGAVPYSQMAKIYHDADIFAYGSSCETFGNILLEAMAAGLPIASSDRSAMPEVLGEAGLYFDPEKPAEISAALLHLIKDRALREQLADKAYRRAAEFSWARCADATFSFLRDCSGATGRQPS
jgi:glycosyltransferase involved in cell wall biosynthesis